MFEKYKEPVMNDGCEFTLDSINGVPIPNDYKEFMRKYNGCEGDIGSAWIILDSKEAFIENNTDGFLQEDERFRDAIMIGSNGGGEYFGIDREGRYFTTPAIGSSEDTVYLGKTLEEFFVRLNEFFG